MNRDKATRSLGAHARSVGVRGVLVAIAALCLRGGVARAEPTADAEAKHLAEQGEALLARNEMTAACSKFRESVARQANPAATAGIQKCVAEADNLFDMAASLLEKGDYRTACAQFEQSMVLDPSAGTQINIAVCLVKRDKNYPAACLAFREARRMNRSERSPERRSRRDADIAREMKQIEDYLPRLQIDVAERPGLTLAVDGDPVDRADLAGPFTICPGERSVEASAPGLVPQTVTVRAAGTESAHLKFELRPEQAMPVPSSSATPGAGSSLRIAGIVVGSVGVVLGGVAVGFAVDIVSKSAAYQAACPVSCSPTSPGIALHDKAVQSQTIAIGTGVASALLLIGGITLYAVAPPSSPPAPQHTVTLQLGPSGASLLGQW